MSQIIKRENIGLDSSALIALFKIKKDNWLKANQQPAFYRA